MFYESSDWHFRKSSAENVENKLDDSYWYNRENVLEPKSEEVFRLCEFAEVDGPSTLFRKAEVEGLSQSVESTDFRCLKDFYFAAAELVRVEGENGNGGDSTSDGPRTWIGLGVVNGILAKATSVGDRGGLWIVTEVFFKI